MEKFLKSYSIYYILIASLVLRIISFYFFSDNQLIHEWAKIIHNYETTGIFGYYVVINEFFAEPKFADPGDKVLPTIFMPPLYLYFIYSVKILSNNLINFIDLILFLQILISLLSIFIFYKICIYFKDKKTSLFLTSIFGFFPINVWSSTQISSITVQIFLIVCFLLSIIKLIAKEKKLKNVLSFSLISGFLILIRGEFFLFYFFTLFYFFLYNRYQPKKIIISVIITFMVISPYIYRNYLLFDTFTITKSFGYNLLKGNNPSAKIQGDPKFIEKEFQRKNLKIRSSNSYEINLDNFYKSKSLEFIEKDPAKYIYLYFKKVLAFIFFDFNSTYPHYFNPLHIAPKVLISIFGIIGAILSLRQKGFFQYVALYYIFNILFFAIFFVLPRYSLFLLPVQILLTIKTFDYLRGKLVN